MDKRKKFLEKLQHELNQPSEEQYLINAIRAYYDLKETKALFKERLEDWVRNSLFIKDFKLEELDSLYKKHNIDPKMILRFYQVYNDISKAEANLKTYIEKEIESKFPNSSYIVGPFLFAMILEKIGSVDKLSKLPASTIQVIGAERALFKHLRSKGKIKPPKHGILYLHPLVNGLPKKLRGKMARTIAAKLAIAIKADLSRVDMKEKLLEYIKKREQELKK
jgi:nucleolar protein 56